MLVWKSSPLSTVSRAPHEGKVLRVVGAFATEWRVAFIPEIDRESRHAALRIYANRHFSELQKLLIERAELFVPHQLTWRPETVARFDSYRVLRRALQDGRPRAKFILKLGFIWGTSSERNQEQRRLD
jgi:hypothetical protein